MTTYIESKLNPDGRTYDHSEVIEACEKGSDIFMQDGYGVWRNLNFINNHSWSADYKYRAVIEDKPEQMDDEWWNLVALEQLVFEKFQSGNAIPVERITLTRAEVNEVFPGLLK